MKSFSHSLLLAFLVVLVSFQSCKKKKTDPIPISDPVLLKDLIVDGHTYMSFTYDDQKRLSYFYVTSEATRKVVYTYEGTTEKITRCEIFTDANSSVGYDLSTYNVDGKLIKVTSYNASGTYIQHDSMSYTAAGALLKLYRFESGPEATEIDDIEYPSTNSIRRIITTPSHKDTLVYTYDDQKNPFSTIKLEAWMMYYNGYFSEGQLYSPEVSTPHNLIGVSEEGTEPVSITYTFNSNGYPSRLSDGDVVFEFNYY